ncbi:hypothetical protein PS943_03648 [Pseudomonas fluorescens]|uniref:Uncharacterized protein n=1 Tax=Pseudomonas fluorescens TaxID=294 RepID=A0A5E7WFC1_PSEFL|nr:hypothetical protein PS943_03648 [Pseudomonas fluorescens]
MKAFSEYFECAEKIAGFASSYMDRISLHSE